MAVGKTPGEPAGSLVRVGSENGHLVRRTQAVRCEDVVHGGADVHLRKRAARFLERLFPTASYVAWTEASPALDGPGDEGAYFQYGEQLTRGGHASEKDSRQLSLARARTAARERRAWALVVPPALFGLLGFAIHLPAAGYPCYWYPVVPIAMWLAVLGMSASSARSDTALT